MRMVRLMAALLVASMCVSESSWAGYIAVPNLVYVNLDVTAYGSLDEKIRALVNRGPDCWQGNSALFYMTRRPTGLTNARVAAAIKGNKAEIKRVGNILLSYRDDEVAGFDGLIVFSSQPQPQFFGLSAKGTLSQGFVLKSTTNESDLEEGFCAVMPPVVRKP